MTKQYKNIVIYALILFVAATALIILSAITQNRVTEQREAELKNIITSNVSQSLEKNIDDINEENNQLKANAEKDKATIESLQKQVDSLTQAKNTQSQTWTERSATLSGELTKASDNLREGSSKSARQTLDNLQTTLQQWLDSDAAAETAAAETVQ